MCQAQGLFLLTSWFTCSLQKILLFTCTVTCFGRGVATSGILGGGTTNTLRKDQFCNSFKTGQRNWGGGGTGGGTERGTITGMCNRWVILRRVVIYLYSKNLIMQQIIIRKVSDE